MIIAAFFGLLGTWSLLAPLNGAVVAPAVVKVDGNRKSIQHLEGGIVRELRVREGDSVRLGDVLVVLDQSQAGAELEVLDQLASVLFLTEARLRAEQAGARQLALPQPLASRRAEADLQAIRRDQQSQLEARLRESSGQAELVQQRIAQLEAQIRGSQAQLAALREQHASLRGEFDTLSPLLAQGIVTRTRLLQIERSAAALSGQIGEVENGIGRAEQAIAEQRQIVVQTGNQRATALAQELRDVQLRLAEVLPKLANARSVFARTVVRAPYAGRVVALSVFAVGAVVGRGEKLMDIVPADGSLVIEARIAVEDAAEVLPQSEAHIRLNGFRQQTTPPLRGQVVAISADRLTDSHTGAPYYAADVRIDEAELRSLPGIRLQPGMSATAMFTTCSRTAFQYLVAPLRASFATALSER